MSTATLTTARQLAAPGCPPWCDITDHGDWDGGDTRHHLSWTVDLAALPYEVHGERYHEHASVTLQQAPGEEPVIVVEMPSDGSGAYREAPMTLAEAEAFLGSLSELIALARRTA